MVQTRKTKKQDLLAFKVWRSIEVTGLTFDKRLGLAGGQTIEFR